MKQKGISGEKAMHGERERVRVREKPRLWKEKDYATHSVQSRPPGAPISAGKVT